MKGLIVLLVVLLPTALFAQSTVKKGSPTPTGVYKTVKVSFETVYDTKWHQGYARQQELAYKVGDSILFSWADLYYYEKKLLKTKRYELWEIHYPGKW